MTTSDMNRKSLKLNTICRDCIFSEFDENNTIQIGCQLGRLDKFKTLGKAELTKDVETDLEYYNIKTICNTCRDATNIYNNPVEEVLKEVQVTCDIIILGDSNRSDWEETILKTAESFKSHTILPSKIIFGFYQKKILFNSLNRKINKIFDDIPIKYDIVNILEDVYDSWSLLDILQRKVQSRYFTICEIDGRLSNQWIERLNNAINIDLKSISMLHPVSKLTGLTIQNLLYRTLGGSQVINILDKVQNLAKEQNLEQMIQNWDEI